MRRKVTGDHQDLGLAGLDITEHLGKQCGVGAPVMNVADRRDAKRAPMAVLPGRPELRLVSRVTMNLPTLQLGAGRGTAVILFDGQLPC